MVWIYFVCWKIDNREKMADCAINIHFFLSLIVDNIAHFCIIVVKEMLKDMVQIEASNAFV